MSITVLNYIDFYKADHRSQYPKGTEVVFSNWTPRGSRIEGVDKVVFFGLQYFIKEYLNTQWGFDFFGSPKDEVVEDYARRMKNAGINITTDHIAALHDLGYLPVEIRALPEGSQVPIGVPMMVMWNTLPEFFWITNYLETSLSACLWGPCTSATIAARYRKLFQNAAEITGGDEAFVDWQGHDFSHRGMYGIEAAMMSGAGHLLSFNGTDTVPAIDFLESYYMADSDEEIVGGSVPATEHSVMCMGTQQDEVGTFRRLINEVYPSGVVSIVSDTWDYWKVWTDYLPQLKEDIMKRDGTVVIRPDCYSEDTKVLTPSGWKLFTDLSDTDKVAQVRADGSYEFVRPLCVVNEHYSGDMIHFYDHHGKVDLLVTPNHRMVFDNDAAGLPLQVKEAKDLSMFWGRKFRRSATAPDHGRELTSLERLKIAFQADGSYSTGCSSIRFSFAKKRKTDRLIDILEDLGVKYSIYDLKDGRNEFNIRISESLTKDFSWVDTSDLCASWASEFMEELSHWDSHIRSQNRFKFDTTNIEAMKVVELVAIAAGRGILVSKATDDRSEKFSDIYTAHIMVDNRIGGQAVRSNVVQYSGRVVCVKVPTGQILVKRNRCTLVSGNSGDPVRILCGDPDAPKGSPEYKGSFELAWEVFGGTETHSGFRKLDPHINLIYGDSITYDRAKDIMEGLIAKNFVPTCVLGIGSFTYQYNTRDTFGFALKATAGVVNGKLREIFKDPKTDSGEKKSARGLLAVYQENGDFRLKQSATWDEVKSCALDLVYRDGRMHRKESLADIRKRLRNG